MHAIVTIEKASHSDCRILAEVKPGIDNLIIFKGVFTSKSNIVVHLLVNKGYTNKNLMFYP